MRCSFLANSPLGKQGEDTIEDAAAGIRIRIGMATMAATAVFVTKVIVLQQIGVQ